MKTVVLEDGKYEFTIADSGLLIDAKRNGEPWPAGMECRYSKSFGAALQRIVELEERLARIYHIATASTDQTMDLGQIARIADPDIRLEDGP